MTDIRETAAPGNDRTATGSNTDVTAEVLQLPRGEALISALVLAQLQADPELSAQSLDNLLCRSLERASRVYGLIQETEDTPPVLRRLLPHALQLVTELTDLSRSQPVACRDYVAEAERRHTRRGQERAADVIAWCIVNQELESR